MIFALILTAMVLAWFALGVIFAKGPKPTRSGVVVETPASGLTARELERQQTGH